MKRMASDVIHMGTGKEGLNKNLIPMKTRNGLEVDGRGRFINLVDQVTKELATAYGKIKSNPGNMTPAADPETLDGMEKRWIQTVSTKIKAGTFVFKPSRRIQIPKPGKNTTRPLTIPGPRDKVIERAMTDILEQIYEPAFLPTSHGFRREKGTHTAIKMIAGKFVGCTFIIEGDISQCYPSIQHDILEDILREDIADEDFIRLLKMWMASTYVEEGKLSQKSEVGIAQGSVISPILCNVYLHRFDQYMERLKARYDKGDTRARNSEYRKVQTKLAKAREALIQLKRNSKEFTTAQKNYRALRKQLSQLPSRNPMDPDFRRVYYVRYADDFVIGIAGPSTEAKAMKADIGTFLNRQLGLTMSEEKTKLTHIGRGKGANFLGVTIQKKETNGNVRQKTGKNKGARAVPFLGLKAPVAKLRERYTERGFIRTHRRGQTANTLVPKPQLGWVNLSHREILMMYNDRIRGILNYYSFVDNKGALSQIVYVLAYSCASTLAAKYKLSSRSKVFRKYGKRLRCPESGVELQLPTHMKRTRTFMTGKTRKPDETLLKGRSNKWTRDILDDPCIMCGKPGAEMHHVRKVRDLQWKVQNKKLDWFTAQMRAINRKQVPLCKEHHLLLHAKKFSDQERDQFKLGVIAYGIQIGAIGKNVDKKKTDPKNRKAV